MNGPDGHPQISDYEAEQERLKKEYCKTLSLTCDICPLDRSGCSFHPGHEQAVKEELPLYEN